MVGDGEVCFIFLGFWILGVSNNFGFIMLFGFLNFVVIESFFREFFMLIVG